MLNNSGMKHIDAHRLSLSRSPGRIPISKVSWPTIIPAAEVPEISDPFLEDKLCLAPPVFEKVFTFGPVRSGGMKKSSEEERAEARFESGAGGADRRAAASSMKFNV